MSKQTRFPVDCSVKTPSARRCSRPRIACSAGDPPIFALYDAAGDVDAHYEVGALLRVLPHGVGVLSTPYGLRRKRG